MNIHSLPISSDSIENPLSFTYPFCYEPHPLCCLAAQEVRNYLLGHPEWHAEIGQGKMFGVLVVSHEGQRGFLAAFSGTFDGQTRQEYFVPPVFDLQAPGCHFQQEEEAISRYRYEIASLQGKLVSSSCVQQEATEALERVRRTFEAHRQERHRLRSVLSGEELLSREKELVRESQFEKAELKRLQNYWNEQIRKAEEPNEPLKRQIQSLQQERLRRSRELQHWLFEQFTFLNANGQSKSLLELFHPFAPPSGAGECAAPRLLQAAYLWNCRPLCMAEFWVGESPRDEVREDGRYYASCRSRCLPILRHMLEGLRVEENPLLASFGNAEKQLRVLLKKPEFIVLSKPAGMLTVPGKEDLPSVQEVVGKWYPDATGPLIVHRLDMDTSGLLVVALTDVMYHHLQQLFATRQVRKMYIAWLERPMKIGQKGTVSLPLRPDPMDRPRQVVDIRHGKSAVTHYEVLDNVEGHARVALWPETGRTHQLRVHCAHADGLCNPIVGDRLYGTAGKRLMLHATRINFDDVSIEDVAF